MIFAGLIISFNVVFNYTFATFLSPGNTDAFRVDKFFQIERKKKKFLKTYENQDFEELKNRLAVDRLNFCKKCESFKPIKTHHCSICKKCIIRKDHHNGKQNIFFYKKI